MTPPSSNLDMLRQRVQQNPQSELFRFSLGKALFDAGDALGAIEHFEVALAKKPDWMVVAILLGRCWKSKGDIVKARQYWEMGRCLAIEQNHEGPLEDVKALLDGLNAS